MNNTAKHPSANRSLAGQAYLLLEQQIVSLRLQPGELLIEKDLVDITGIGRTPVREAIQRLAAAGLLQVLPRKGLMVAPLRRSDLEKILEARKVLQRLLVVKAAERATPDQRQALQTLATHIEAAGNDLEAFLRLDIHLDELLGLACHNPFLVRALTALSSQCRRLWYLHRREEDLLHATRLHSALARMVADGNGSGAIRALDENIATLEDLASRLDVLI